MARASKDPEALSHWLRNKATLNFLAEWEGLYNKSFKHAEFGVFKNLSKNVHMSATLWIDTTDAIGVYVKRGKTGGTFAHKDIAFEFGMYISARFKLYLIKEYQRLKEKDERSQDGEWNVRRVMSKMACHVLTDAIKEHVLPQASDAGKHFAYSNEMDLINRAFFDLMHKFLFNTGAGFSQINVFPKN